MANNLSIGSRLDSVKINALIATTIVRFQHTLHALLELILGQGASKQSSIDLTAKITLIKERF
jgi:hypothetical protein